MKITLEQARTLVAVVDAGSYAKAAKAIGKGHSAVIYTLKSFESALGVDIFDRNGYRSKLTSLGRQVHERCQRLLEAARDVELAAENRAVGWEPVLKVVFDGLLPVVPFLKAAEQIRIEAGNETRVFLYSEYLGDVEKRFKEVEAQVMVSIVRAESTLPHMEDLPSLNALLVAHRSHPLAKKGRALRAADLMTHPFLVVRGSERMSELSTSKLIHGSTFHLGDFHAKKYALLRGMGYGWMPVSLIRNELKSGQLVALRWGDKSRHQFHPVFYSALSSGRGAKVFLNHLRNYRGY